jgi:hypothetical protein
MDIGFGPATFAMSNARFETPPPDTKPRRLRLSLSLRPVSAAYLGLSCGAENVIQQRGCSSRSQPTGRTGS